MPGYQANHKFTDTTWQSLIATIFRPMALRPYLSISLPFYSIFILYRKKILFVLSMINKDFTIILFMVIHSEDNHNELLIDVSHNFIILNITYHVFKPSFFFSQRKMLIINVDIKCIFHIHINKLRCSELFSSLSFILDITTLLSFYASLTKICWFLNIGLVLYF